MPERLLMVKALKVVKDAWINTGSGLLDFKEEIASLQTRYIFVNADGHTLAKKISAKNLVLNIYCGANAFPTIIYLHVDHLAAQGV